MKLHKMTLTRFSELASAYGSELSRWPVPEREGARELLEYSEPARAVLAEQALLDGWLGEQRIPELPSELERRLNELPIRTPQPARRWPFGTVWAPALGWAAAAVFGIALGALSVPDDNEIGVASTDRTALDDGARDDESLEDEAVFDLMNGSLAELPELP